MVKYLAEKIFIKFIDGTEQDFPKGMTLTEIIALQGKADQKVYRWQSKRGDARPFFSGI